METVEGFSQSNIPFLSHNIPSKFFEQLQIKVPPKLSEHLPPFLQGRTSHGETEKKKTVWKMLNGTEKRIFKKLMK